MWLVVGLGNPGSKYQNNRHNIGFMAVDEIHRHFAFSVWKKKFQAELCEGTVTGVEEKIILLKPQTYMNLSGDSVQAAAQFYKIPLSNIVVFHDELDVAPGKVKIKQGGGAGGHNGIKSIDEHMGPTYWRVRLGIGHPDPRAPDKSEIVSNYVLSDFAKAEHTWRNTLLEQTAKYLALLLKGRTSDYINMVVSD
ncbi:MAG: aminoacyl-tRNA hydrolase [Alphaproteobacteria bacterium]|nr:aminoacyl-tRNA hydrolase [Alphaproteobacteria bacterium]